MISIFYGTRPEYIKLISLYKKIKSEDIPVELVQVSQHTSLLKNFYYDRIVNVNSCFANRLNSIASSCLSDNIFNNETDLVVIQGDTATAFFVALNAFHNKIKIAHVEAGLRSNDIMNPYPEEAYRRFISSISSYNFCPTHNNANNLRNENVPGEICVVGNTVLDDLIDIECYYGNEVLVTLHRRENIEKMQSWLYAIEACAIENQDLKFIMPMHPSFQYSMYTEILKNTSAVEPMSHDDLLEIMRKSRFLITDSGGIQEESSFLKKKSIVCRKCTERQEGIGVFSFLCPDPSGLSALVKKLKKGYYINYDCPYGDGNSVDKIFNLISHIVARK